MAQKMGSPPSDNPMKDKIFIIVSKKTKEKLDECANELNDTRSDVVRNGIDMVHDNLKKQQEAAHPMQGKRHFPPRNYHMGRSHKYYTLCSAYLQGVVSTPSYSSFFYILLFYVIIEPILF